jgi:hypothetical protein
MIGYYMYNKTLRFGCMLLQIFKIFDDTHHIPVINVLYKHITLHHNNYVSNTHTQHIIKVFYMHTIISVMDVFYTQTHTHCIPVIDVFYTHTPYPIINPVSLVK